MCGRATLTCPVDDIAEVFGVTPISIGPPRFNIAPTQDIPVVRTRRPSSSGGGERELALLRWGLIPWSSRDARAGHKHIQARAETVARAPAYRIAFREQRCLIIVDGFYEWSGTAKERQPHHVKRPGGGPFALAGVWDSWTAPDKQVIQTCAVVTAPARGPVASIHDRMPLLLEGADRDRWLSQSPEDASALVAEALRATEATAQLVVVPVSTWVNEVRHDDSRCLEPAAPPAQATFLF